MCRALALGFVFSMVGATVFADPLESTFSFKVVEVDAEGNENLIKRTSVKPSEVIHYELRHKNNTEDAMAGLVIAAPVPEGVTITLGAESSSMPAVFEVQAEMDPEKEGLEWSTIPAVRKVADASGALHEEPLPDTEIQAVRWSLSEALLAGEASLNVYRVQVN